MTSYLLDTDVFIRAKNQHYGFDLCPGFWTWIDREHAAMKVFSIQRVYDELLAGKDDYLQERTNSVAGQSSGRECS